MKLYEEMKMWEAMWDDPKSAKYTDDEIWNLVDGLIAKIPENYLFEYGGFTDEGYEDHFDPGSWYGHYQTSSSSYYSDFTYEVEPGDMYEKLAEGSNWAEIIEAVKNRKYKHRLLTDPLKEPGAKDLLNTVAKLEKELKAVPREQNQAQANKYYLFIAENLDALVEILYEYLCDYYEENAYEWARDNMEPDWD